LLIADRITQEAICNTDGPETAMLCAVYFFQFALISPMGGSSFDLWVFQWSHSSISRPFC